MSLRNPTQGPRIVPFGHARLSTDRLPNGRLGFRVTQRFHDIDRFFGGWHNAIDLGNFQCGDALLASHGGWIRNRRDIYGALIVDVVENNGNFTGHGHLSRFAQNPGRWVNPGTVIGYVGSTGLGGVCHSHMYRVEGGRYVDPWPRLDQNQVRSTRVAYAHRVYSIGVPWIRASPGGAIIGQARLNQQFDGWQIEKAGPRYQDWRNGAWRSDWVILRDGRSIAKAFIKVVPR
jgi:murein DD-endopeptidase MepM/ murein hydrolase activator NlpD